MKSLKLALLTLLIALMMILTACATEQPSGGNNPTGGNTPAAGGDVVVKKANIDVKGTKKDVLTSADGKTLYYFKPDTATESNCKGDCATTWPPYLYTGSGTPSVDGGDSSKLKVVTTVHGKQLSYNGHLLYNFAGDGGPGDSKGEGLGGNWFVVEP